MNTLDNFINAGKTEPATVDEFGYTDEDWAAVREYNRIHENDWHTESVDEDDFDRKLTTEELIELCKEFDALTTNNPA